MGPGERAYIVAEMSANHLGDYARAEAIVRAAAASGADAIKLQTYTPDTLTLDCDNAHFRLPEGSPWAGRTLYDLYAEASTPWEWHAPLKALAEELGLGFFSTPFDETAVDFLEKLGVAVYKIASFELTHWPLLRKVASTNKPVIVSTGTGSWEEIVEGVNLLREHGSGAVAVLKCTSGYPAPPEEMNLRSIPYLAHELGVAAGVSDHTLSDAVPVAAVAVGACIIEKHLTLCRADGGPDAAFSLEPKEFARMVAAVREAQRALGAVCFASGAAESENRILRRSIFAAADIKRGEAFTESNLRIIRPGHGLAPKHWEPVLRKRAACDIARGTPLAWSMVEGAQP